MDVKGQRVLGFTNTAVHFEALNVFFRCVDLSLPPCKSLGKYEQARILCLGPFIEPVIARLVFFLIFKYI